MLDWLVGEALKGMLSLSQIHALRYDIGLRAYERIANEQTEPWSA